jgi:hypothetical protein
MVLEALLKSVRASEPGDKVVLVSNYTGEACGHLSCQAGRLTGLLLATLKQPEVL